MSQFIVGLTGGIGSGKSTVVAEFIKFGVVVVDADIVAREIVAPGSLCLQAIVERFGPSILLADGSLDRTQLRAIIFSDTEQKQWLNALTHPEIRKEILTQLAQAQSDYCLLVAPLLFENQLEQYCHYTLVVDVTEQTQLARTIVRDKVSEQQVHNIIKSQISRQERLAKADEIVDNDRPWPEVAVQLPSLHHRLVEMARKLNDPATRPSQKS